jgi:hypothetical protein
MADNEVGKALLKLEAAADDDAAEQARRVIRRDRWLVRGLTALSVLLWLAAAAGVFFVVWVAVWFVFPRHQKLARDFAVMTVEQIADAQTHNLQAWELCTEIITASFIALTLAALSTVWLVLLSRRATLREVNASLAAIAAELRLLRQSSLAAENK